MCVFVGSPFLKLEDAFNLGVGLDNDLTLEFGQCLESEVWRKMCRRSLGGRKDLMTIVIPEHFYFLQLFFQSEQIPPQILEYYVYHRVSILLRSMVLDRKDYWIEIWVLPAISTNLLYHILEGHRSTQIHPLHSVGDYRSSAIVVHIDFDAFDSIG